MNVPTPFLMGCIGSKSAKKDVFKKAERWKSEKPVTRSELNRLRDEFWETAPAYGGSSGTPSPPRPSLGNPRRLS